MTRIKKLDQLIANKIAAGEVVDRPSSVVKELVENSIDAKASKIVVEIKDAGKSYIRITDDGIGINPLDVEVAFERHATSKIRAFEDLNTIASLGFRGEALASIASVSQIELITKTKDVLSGTFVKVHGGKIIEHKEMGCPNGTTFIVKNLFYNVPARFQFMKSNATETSYISDLMSKLALAYPKISFRFINNGQIMFSTPGTDDVLHNVAGIYGKEMAKNMIYREEERSNVQIKAYFSKPNFSRGNKKLQVFFVNGRYIKSKIISQAIEQAYQTLLMVKRYAVCFLYLTLPPEEVDVNIHPTKTEVRFDKEMLIKELVKDTLKKGLFEKNLIPSVGFHKPKKNEGIQEKILDIPIQNPSIQVKKMSTPLSSRQDYDIKIPKVKEEKTPYRISTQKKKEVIVPKQNKRQQVINRPTSISSEPIQTNPEKVSVESESKRGPYEKLIKDIKIIGQIFHTYLIGQGEDKMYLIDQHAAHERILFEEFVKGFKKHSVISQKTFVPIVVELSFEEFEIVKKNQSFLEKLGFEVEEFGVNTFMLRSVPVIFGQPQARSFFLELINHLDDHTNQYDLKVEKIISMACKHAIKANDALDQLEIDELMERLSQLENPFTCPHGRPVIISMTQYEIERKFKRT